MEMLISSLQRDRENLFAIFKMRLNTKAVIFAKFIVLFENLTKKGVCVKISEHSIWIPT